MINISVGSICGLFFSLMVLDFLCFFLFQKETNFLSMGPWYVLIAVAKEEQK